MSTFFLKKVNLTYVNNLCTEEIFYQNTPIFPFYCTKAARECNHCSFWRLKLNASPLSSSNLDPTPVWWVLRPGIPINANAPLQWDGGLVRGQDKYLLLKNPEIISSLKTEWDSVVQFLPSSPLFFLLSSYLIYKGRKCYHGNTLPGNLSGLA